MSASLLYRIAAVLLVFFALGHQLGFRKVSPEWHVEEVVQGMQTTRFTVQGFSRTYWGFFSGFGFFVTVLLAFSAILAWQFGRMPSDVLANQALARWAFAICYIVIAILTWKYFFMAPGTFATVVALCLTIAAAQAQRAPSGSLGVVRTYFDRLANHSGWEGMLADDMTFTSFTSPVKVVNGRDPFLASTKRFYSSIGGVDVRRLDVADDRIYALTRYVIRPPSPAPSFNTDVAEVFQVKDGRISALDIYFDSAPYPK
jgi:hypothetical protein